MTRLGTYELVRPLAQGGMADIYLARSGDRHVAIKVLNANRSGDAEACTMFLDEARLVAMLNHENIARVLDVDVVEDGQHYLAMEYVHGADLRELLAAAAHTTRMSGLPAAPPIPFEVALSIVIGAASGLDHAHRRCGPDGKPLRLVHRDVSLSNIMVAHDGIVKVVDFGIASTTIATVHTAPGVVRGKASYMSPEQCLGDRVDHRTDVFALGIVLYELTTGARCFAGKTDFDRMLAVVRGHYIAPREINPEFPAELEQVIRCALSTDATLRYPSAAALIEGLEHVAAAQSWQLGTAPITALMQQLFGEVPQPCVMTTVEPLFTEAELEALALPELVPSTVRSQPRMARGTEHDVPPRLARGSEPDLLRASGWYEAGGADDDDDAPTRGRRVVRRSLATRILAA